ncbi:MAG: Uma2 family endonuclease [Armatimonadetes bacterium]|nr:Uma2 family endonuclease [Armatimonadota bacterium]
MVAVKYITYEEFLASVPDGAHAEWVGGEVIFLSPVNTRHQRIKRFLVNLFSFYVERDQLGEVLDAPMQMRLSKVRRGREPDILFVASERLDRITPTYIDGPADLVVEIVFPESAERDRKEKFAEYRAEGVREYWLIDPETKQAEFYALYKGRYAPRLPDEAGWYHSEALKGFSFPVEWLYQEPLPPLMEALKTLGLV